MEVPKSPHQSRCLVPSLQATGFVSEHRGAESTLLCAPRSMRGYFMGKPIYSSSFAQLLTEHLPPWLIMYINICSFPAGLFPVLNRTHVDSRFSFLPPTVNVVLVKGAHLWVRTPPV